MVLGGVAFRGHVGQRGVAGGKGQSRKQGSECPAGCRRGRCSERRMQSEDGGGGRDAGETGAAAMASSPASKR